MLRYERLGLRRRLQIGLLFFLQSVRQAFAPPESDLHNHHRILCRSHARSGLRRQF